MTAFFCSSFEQAQWEILVIFVEIFLDFPTKPGSEDNSVKRHSQDWVSAEVSDGGSGDGG